MINCDNTGIPVEYVLEVKHSVALNEHLIYQLHTKKVDSGGILNLQLYNAIMTIKD